MYLFSLPKVWMMEETVEWGTSGCTRRPVSAIVRRWLLTWSISVAWISSGTAWSLRAPWPLPPILPPRTLTPPLLIPIPQVPRCSEIVMVLVKLYTYMFGSIHNHGQHLSGNQTYCLIGHPRCMKLLLRLSSSIFIWLSINQLIKCSKRFIYGIHGIKSLTNFDNWTDYCACNNLYNDMMLTCFGENNH